MVKSRRILSVVLSLVMVIAMFPLTIVNAASYTTYKSGSVTWTMINDEPGAYYWVDSNGAYCALTAVKSGSKYYVTLYTTKKGSELRYLKPDKDDDSGSEQDWGKKSAAYTGGKLYKADGTSSGGGSETPTDVSGTYSATSTSYVSKDSEKYYTTVTITVSNGKVTAFNATSTATSSDNKAYFSKALSGIKSKIVGMTATKTLGNSVDSVSGATKSSTIIKEAINLAMANLSSGGSGSGGSGGTTGTTLADGTYSATSTSKVDKDSSPYTATVSVTVKSGKVSAMTASASSTTSKNLKYFNNAVSGIQSKVVGQTATYTLGDEVDSVSGATKSSKIIKEALTSALAKAKTTENDTPTVSYTVTWKNYDGTTLETNTNVTSGTKPSYNGTTPSRSSDTQYDYTFAGWATSTNQTTGTAVSGLPTVSANVTYYAAFSKTERVSVANGLYGDNSATVQRFNYTPIVTVTVSNNRVTALTADADTNSTNLEILGEAVEGLQSKIVGQSVSAAANLSDTDAVSGATYASKAVITDIKNALSSSPKGTYTVTWKNADGTTLKTQTAQYGAKTTAYTGIPTKASDSDYSYEFKSWTPSVSYFVTGNATYTATYTATEIQKEPEYNLTDGIYGDNSVTVQRFNYTPVVSVTVKNNTITAISAGANTTNTNQDFLERAVSGLSQNVTGRSVSAAMNLDSEVDTVSGATYASRAVITAIRNALSTTAKGTYTVTWQNYDGTILRTDRNIAYGTRTSEYTDTPTRTADSDYSYEFSGWTPSVNSFVTDNVTYTATYTAKELEKAELADGIYGDDSVKVERFNYTPIVTVEVKDNKIVSIKADADKETVNTTQNDYFEFAVEELEIMLVGKNVSSALNLEADTVSGATYSGRALIAEIKKALSSSPKGSYTIVWKDDNGQTLKTDSNVLYGARTENYAVTPTKADTSSYSYTFNGWTPELSYFVTGNATYTANYTSEKKEIPEIKIADGLYGDNSIALERFRYVPIVTVEVKNNKIVSVSADAKTTATNLGYLETALEKLQQQLIGESVTNVMSLDPETDTVSGATFAGKALIKEIQQALSESPKGYYTVVWKNADGTILRTDSNIAYGTKTASYDKTPTKAETYEYRYEFKGFSPETAYFVTENAEYTAEYQQIEKEQVQLADGIYGDNSVTAERFDYTPIVTVEVKDNKIVSVKADVSDDELNGTERDYFDFAAEELNEMLVGKNIGVAMNLNPETDTVSGATYVGKALIEEIKKALSGTAKGSYTVVWKNADGTILKTESDVVYGTRTPVYPEIPTQAEDSDYSYTFSGWTPEIKYFVTGNTVYTANYDKKQKLSLTSAISAAEIPLGETVKATLTAKGGESDYVYAYFSKLSAAKTWTLRSDYWVSESEFEFTFDKPGTYDICVKAKDSANTEVKEYYQVTVRAEELVNTSSLSTSSTDLGKSVTVNAAAQGGTGSYHYSVYYKKTADKKWIMTSNWTEDSKFDVTLPSAGDYQICVKVKDSIGTISKTYLDVTVNAAELINTSTIRSLSVNFGESVSVKATAEGGIGSYYYSVYYKKSTDGKWTMTNNWSADTEFDVTLPNAGDYQICVKVKDTKGTIAKTYLDVTVNAAELVNTSTISTSAAGLGESVTVNATAQGGIGSYHYSVYYKKSTDSKWTMTSNWTADNEFDVTLPYAGDYQICVKVKDAKGTIAKTYLDVTVNAAELINASTISSEKITSGETVTLTGQAVGGTGYYKYSYYYKKSTDKKWTMTSNWTADTVNELKLDEKGTYDICIKVKDSSDKIEKAYFELKVES